MFDSTTPIPLGDQLPADAYWHLIRALRLTLPPPPDANPAAFALRDHAAIASIAALAPADAAEADLAAQFVAASEQWKDCLRLAQLPETTREWAAKCRAQALTMMRQSNAALRLLLRMQAARGRLDNAATDRRAWTEHTATRLMAEALAASPPPEPVAKSEPVPDSLSRAAGEGRGEGPAGEAGGIAHAGRGEGPTPAPPSWIRDGVDLLAAAERYAAAYPERAAAIRRTGKLPCDVRYFDPPEASLADALIAGTPPALAALDGSGDNRVSVAAAPEARPA